ncbi:hypothetical protein N7447_004950 [Penicillium robsamsonii]|uniref:uncharacterized protein n=1 Tax=Penicillium robsamsonii TaxID=1792511 RepID=UPI002546F86C|nr:uncharacterized protein N7447_004950 [Penicillium robsamsonii]KAJ5822610.1 hypothetical protein N7447_004950 [Penicillium robsamsonii]
MVKHVSIVCCGYSAIISADNSILELKGLHYCCYVTNDNISMSDLPAFSTPAIERNADHTLRRMIAPATWALVVPMPVGIANSIILTACREIERKLCLTWVAPSPPPVSGDTFTRTFGSTTNSVMYTVTVSSADATTTGTKASSGRSDVTTSSSVGTAGSM